jgi:hypothetical protein
MNGGSLTRSSKADSAGSTPPHESEQENFENFLLGNEIRLSLLTLELLPLDNPRDAEFHDHRIQKGMP